MDRTFIWSKQRRTIKGKGTREAYFLDTARSSKQILNKFDNLYFDNEQDIEKFYKKINGSCLYIFTNRGDWKLSCGKSSTCYLPTISLASKQLPRKDNLGRKLNNDRKSFENSFEFCKDIFKQLENSGYVINAVTFIKDNDFDNYIKKVAQEFEKQSQLNKDSLSIEGKKDPNEQLKTDLANNAAENLSKDVVKDAMKESYMLERIKEYFENQHTLREDFSLHIEDIVDADSIERWQDKPAIEVIKAAKKKDRSAIEFIYYQMRGTIAKKMWSDFLGPNKEIAYKRLRDGAKEEWLSIAWQVLTSGFSASLTAYGTERSEIGAIDQFDPGKVKDEDKLWNAFAYIYANKLHLAAKDIGESDKRTGISGVGDNNIETSDISKFNGKAEDSEAFEYKDKSTEDTAIDNIEASEFMDNWKKFVQDDELNNKKRGVSYANALAAILENPEETNLKNLAATIGLARMTFKTYVEKAIEIMDYYGIDQEDLFKGLNTFGSRKVVSYLDKA